MCSPCHLPLGVGPGIDWFTETPHTHNLYCTLYCYVPQEYFIKYYDSCMPLMTSILTHASGARTFIWCFAGSKSQF